MASSIILLVTLVLSVVPVLMTLMLMAIFSFIDKDYFVGSICTIYFIVVLGAAIILALGAIGI